MVAINKDFLSLHVGVWEKLEADTAVAWSSDNPNVYIDEYGWVIALREAFREDTPSGQAILTARSGAESATCAVTVVNWTVNRLRLEVEAQTYDYYPSLVDGVIYGLHGTLSYKTLDGFGSVQRLPDLPANATNSPILSTPHGFYVRCGGAVYKTLDFQSWELVFQGDMYGLYHAFDCFTHGDTAYIFMGEYSTVSSNRHKVYRGVLTAISETWETVLEFYSRDEGWADPVNNNPSARHIHVTAIDPYTGHVYVGVGDTDAESRIMVSRDFGQSWEVFGGGSQNWRILAVWFTERYIYWNMDTHLPQSVWRLARTDLELQLTGVDSKELVAQLDDGSHWYTAHVVDDAGNNMVVMGAAVEGQLRDWRARVYGISESSDESVEVQELIAVASNDPMNYVAMAQLEPKFQDGNGYIYLRGRDTEHVGLWKMRLVREPKPRRHIWKNSFIFSVPVFN